MCCYGQDSIRITGHLVNNSKYAVAVLEKFGVGSYPIVKSGIDKNTGNFYFALPVAGTDKGIYRIRYSFAEPGRQVDVIINGEPSVDFSINLWDTLLSPKFTQSAENQAWYAYRMRINQQNDKIAHLTELLNNYPDKKAPLVAQLTAEREKEIQLARKIRDQYIRGHKDDISGKMEARIPYRYPNIGTPYQLQAYNNWSTYWQSIDVSDTSLLATPLYTELIIGYMLYWLDEKISFSEKEKTEGFIKSIDTVIQRFSVNPVMRRFALEYLTLGFKELAYEDVLQYLDEKYNSSNQCSDGLDPELEKRLEAYKEIAPGKPAPRIYYTNVAGVEQEYLKNVETDTIIIAFWAGWCPHCMQTMPVLDSLVAQRKNISTLAISLDTDAKEFAEASAHLKSMQHFCDFQKWNSRTAKDYHVKATPTLFLIDKDRFIVGKYGSVNALLQALK